METSKSKMKNGNCTNWGHVQRIIHRQTSPRTLKESLERIVEEFDLPFELFILVVTKVHGAPGLSSLLFRCIRNIWRRVLVDRGENAFRFFDRLRQEPGPVHAQRENTKELFAIQSRHDLIQNPIFLQAFKKTKYLIQTIQKYDPRTLPPTVSLLHALVHANMPPFLILLAARDEPDSIMKRDILYRKIAVVFGHGYPASVSTSFISLSNTVHPRQGGCCGWWIQSPIVEFCESPLPSAAPLSFVPTSGVQSRSIIS